jgi:transcriptional activator SPT7
MKQKADHHLNFLVDKADRDKDSISALLPTPSGASPAPSQLLRASASGVHTPSHPSSLRAVSNAPGDDEDAAGESDDGYGLGDESFQSDGQSFLRAPDDGAGAKFGER